MILCLEEIILCSQRIPGMFKRRTNRNKTPSSICAHLCHLWTKKELSEAKHTKPTPVFAPFAIFADKKKPNQSKQHTISICAHLCHLWTKKELSEAKHTKPTPVFKLFKRFVDKKDERSETQNITIKCPKNTHLKKKATK